MYTHILVPTDGTPLSMKAVKTAATLAARLKARITTLYVKEPFIPPSGEAAIVLSNPEIRARCEKAMTEQAAAALRKAEAAVARAKVKCEPISLEDPHPWEGIIRAAREQRCDLIVMASHGRRGLEGLLLGSETQKVLTHSKTPVLVCR